VDTAAVLSGDPRLIQIRLILRLIMEMVGLLADLADRKARSKKASKRRMGPAAIHREIDALMTELRRLEKSL
jgi:hypothetical protein